MRIMPSSQDSHQTDYCGQPSTIFHYWLAIDCNCPIHLGSNPFITLFGLPFADHVYIEPLPGRIAIAVVAIWDGESLGIRSVS